MASMFDLSPYGSLMTPQAKKQAQSQMLMQLGAGLLAGSGPSLTPTSFGQNLGRALPPALQAYQQNAQQSVQAGLLGQKIKDDQAARARAAEQRKAQQRLSNSLLYGMGTQGGRAMMSQGQLGQGPAPTNRQIGGMLADAGDTKSAVDVLTATPPAAKTVEMGVGNGMKQRAILNPDGTTTPIGQPYSAFAPPQPDRTLVKVPDRTSPTGFRYAPRSEAMNMPAPAGQSLDITLPDGTRVTSGANRNFTETGDQPRSIQAIEQEIEGIRDTYANVAMFKDQFRPEWQTVESRLGLAWTGGRAKWGSIIPGMDANIDPAARQELVEFAAFRRNAIGGLNDYIKEITGAQMSEAEAKRITAAFPKVGEGVFDGDDPVTFESKMNEVMVNLELAMARKTHSLREGLDWKKISLPRMRVILREQAEEIRRRLRRENPTAEDAEIDTMGREEFQRRFFGGGAA